MLNQHKDPRRDRRFHFLVVSYHPGSTLLAAADPAGSTSVVVAVHTVPQEDHTGPEEARSQGLADRDWVSCHNSHCCWAGPAGMAACHPDCRDQHRGGWVVATEGIAAVRPIFWLTKCSRELKCSEASQDMWRKC